MASQKQSVVGTPPLWRYALRALLPFRWMIFGMGFTASLWAIDISLRPFIFKRLLNTLVGTSPGPDVWSKAGIWVGLYAVLSLTIVAVNRLYDWFQLKVIPPLKQHLSLILVQRLIGHSHRFYQNHLLGDLSNKFKDVVGGVPDALVLVLDKFFSHTLALVIAMITSYMVSPFFGIAMLTWAILLVLGMVVLTPRIRHLSEDVAGAVSLLMGQLTDIVTNMLLVRLFSRQQTELQRFSSYTQNATKVEQKLEWWLLVLFLWQGLTFFVLQITCLLVLIQGYCKGWISIGDFALIAQLNVSVMELFWRLSKDSAKFIELCGRIRQGLALLLRPQEIIDASQAPALQVTRGEIKFQNVTFTYQNNQLPVFDNFSLTIPGGQKIGVVGYSGVGKTTLIALLLRLFDVDKGVISIDNQDISKVTQESLRRSIGVIPQETALFHRSLFDNITYGAGNIPYERVEEVAKQVGLHDFITGLPQGYDSLVGERGIKLSGGQRQRLALMRVVLHNPPILLLDEATSALDSLTEKVIQEYLEPMMSGRTTLVIAHRLSTLRSMDRIIVLDKGHIVQDGPHEELLNQPHGVYAQLWRAQSQGFLPSELNDDEILPASLS